MADKPRLWITRKKAGWAINVWEDGRLTQFQILDVSNGAPLIGVNTEGRPVRIEAERLFPVKPKRKAS